MLGLGPGFRGIPLRYLTWKLLKVLCRDCPGGIKGYAVMYGVYFRPTNSKPDVMWPPFQYRL